MHLIIRAVIAAGICVVLSQPVCAAAQETEDIYDTEARALFVAGTVAYRDGRYQEAYNRYSEAYAASERPELLYNLAMAAERLRKDELAITHYRAFLVAIPDAENRDTIEHRIDFLSERLENDRLEAESAAAAVEDERQAAVEHEAEVVAEARSSQNALITTYALGGATLATGVVLIWSGVDAQNKNDAYEDAIADMDVDAARAALDDAHDAEKRTNILIGVTAALGAGTLTAAIIHMLSDSDDDASVDVGVSAGRGGAALTVRGMF